MTYNCSSRVDPCTYAPKGWMINPQHHHKFNPWYHNFDPCDHNRFNPYDNGLELNIQLPDINIPSCPPAPACPPCPELKPEPKPESKDDDKSIPFDIKKLAISTLPGTDKILNLKTSKETGMSSKECGEIIASTRNDLRISDGKIVGKCYDNTECDKCVDALNSSIIMVLATDHNTQAADPNIYFL